MALRPGESTEVPDIKRPESGGKTSFIRGTTAVPEGLTAEEHARFSQGVYAYSEKKLTDISALSPAERIKFVENASNRAWTVSTRVTVGKANENNTSESVIPGTEDNQLSEEDKKKLEEEKAARALKLRKAISQAKGQTRQYVKSKYSPLGGYKGWTGDIMAGSQRPSDAELEELADKIGLSDEEIDQLAAEYDEPTWQETAGLAVSNGMAKVGEGIGYCADKLSEGYDYVAGKLEEAEGYLNDGMDWLKENVLENEYFKMLTDTFADGFCSMQPFPACLSCPHRKALLSTEGFDLFRLVADINGALRKGIFDKVSSLVDCPGLAGALANGDLGSLKETMMTKGLDALVLTGIRCGSGVVFGALGSCISNPAGKGFALAADSLVNKYSGAIMKSVRSGHLDLISGTMKIADVRADSFFRISTKNTNYQFVNSTVSSSSYQKAYAKKYGLRSYPPVTADTLPSSAKAAVKALEAAVTKSADEAKSTLDNATTEMSEDIAATKTKLASIEAETKKLMDETGSSEEDLVNAGLVDDKEAVEAELSAKLKSKAENLDSNAALLSEQAPAESAADKETLSSSGIRTRNSAISANRMSGVYGCTSSLHSLKLAYGADNRVTGRRLPGDIRFRNRSRRREGVIIKTKSDLLFT